MTCKPKQRRAFVALTLALALASCGENARPPDAAAGAEAGDSAFARLMTEAETAMANGALPEAGQLLDEARAISPDEPDLWVAIARLRFRGGEHLTALEAADHALMLGPDHAPALLMRAYMVRDAHGFAPSLPWFEATLAADPESADGWAEYAATLGDMGQASAMLEAARKLAEVAPDDPRAAYLQAVLAARAGEHATARSLLARSGMAARGVPAAMLLDAAISQAQGNPDSAADVLSRLAARQPGNARLRELLARALLDSGRETELIARFGAEVQRAETSPYLLMVLGRAHERLGDRAAAAPLLERAQRAASAAPAAMPAVLADRDGLPPQTSELRRLAFAGDWGGAQAAASGLQGRFPLSADIANFSGDVALGAGDGRAALEHYARAARVRRPWRLAGKAVLAYRQVGDQDAAFTVLARHVAGEPDNLDAVVQLAGELADAGDWTRTALLLDHAVALGGGNDPALLGLRLRAARALGKGEDATRFATLLAEISPPRLTPR